MCPIEQGNNARFGQSLLPSDRPADNQVTGDGAGRFVIMGFCYSIDPFHSVHTHVNLSLVILWPLGVLCHQNVPEIIIFLPTFLFSLPHSLSLSHTLFLSSGDWNNILWLWKHYRAVVLKRHGERLARFQSVLLHTMMTKCGQKLGEGLTKRIEERNVT